MTKAEQFRRKAEETEAKAQAAYEEHVKQAYREVARYWRELAEEAETSSRH